MTTRKLDRGADARLVEVRVADDIESWADAGFTVVDRTITVGDVVVRLVGSHPEHRGIVGWDVAGLIPVDHGLDGLPTGFVPLGHPPADRPVHANGTIGLDHIVVVSPDLQRSIDALATSGLVCRRIRDTTSDGAPVRQAFFKLGPVVVEVVAGESASSRPDGPSGWFGLAFDVDDLDQSADVLGDGLGPVKPAVQSGRRIATLRHKTFGISLAVAFMDDHGSRS